MIISRTPMRVSFCGGGSDLPSFYKKYEGCVLSCAIKKYVYIAIHPSFFKKSITLKYSKTEEVDSFSDIEHKYFRVMLQDYNVKGVEITSMADIPAGTGLGSSSAFTVGVLRALKEYTGKRCSKYALASEACDVEINRAGSPIGKQDQFASAFGGINLITFHKDDKVSIEPIVMPKDSEEKLEKNILLFYTGLKHDANAILAKQNKNLMKNKNTSVEQLKLCELAKDLKNHLEAGDIDYLGIVLRKSWEIKKSLSEGITNSIIEDIYERGIKAGASGGKLLGAGGGGFMLFYVKDGKQDSVRKALSDLKEISFEIDYEGSDLIYGI